MNKKELLQNFPKDIKVLLDIKTHESRPEFFVLAATADGKYVGYVTKDAGKTWRLTWERKNDDN